MSRRKGLHVVLMLGLVLALLPIGAAAQELAAQVGAAPQWDKPGDGLPDGKEPPDDAPGLPLDFVAGSEAVATGYGWSQTTGTYTEITGGTVVTTSCDDTSYANIALPFTFTYDGTAYTAVSIQCNGFIAMGAAISSSYTPISTGTTNNVIVAIGEDQQTNTTNSEIRYETLGTTPNQVFVIQWKNFRHYAATGDSRNYQIRLHETTNLVEVVYGPFTQNATNRTCQVGLRGAANTDFNNRTSTGAWTASTAGATNAASMALTTANVPPSGLTWAWTPLAPSPFFGTSTKTAPAQALMGDPVAYTVSIVNSGTATASAATMVDPIPAGTTYNSDVTCSAGTCGFDGSNVTWSGTVAVGETVTISFSVDTDGAPCGDLVNEATLDDPGLVGGPVTRSASTQLVSLTPTPLDGFEVSVPPAGWTVTDVVLTTGEWTRVTTGTYPTIAPHGGSAMAKFNSFDQSGGATRLWTNALDLSGYAAPAVVFWMSHDTGYSGNADRIQVQVSLDGTTWVDVGAPVLRYDAAYTSPGWGEHTVALPAGYNVNGVYIGFLGISAYGNNFYLDDTALAEGWYPCSFTSLTPDGASTTCPGGSVTYPLTLTNMTPDPDTFDVTFAGNAWPTTPTPDQLTLAAGASGSVTVSVQLPSAPGSDTAVVTALGQTHGGTDTTTLVTTGSTAYWGAIASEPDNGRMDNVSAAWDGKVWSITGYGANLNVRSYDPLTDAWTVVGTPPTAFAGNYVRSGCQAGSKLYMYGDASTAGFTGLWSYDMATGVWLQETPGGTPPTPTGIWAPAWAHDAETGYCYLTGGATVAGAGTLTTVHVFDPATNAWLAQLPDFTSVRDFHAAWVFRDAASRKLLCVAGGNNGAGMTSTQCYDFAAGAWGAENADIGPLPADLWGMGYAQKMHEGSTQIWMTGGVRAGSLTAQTTYFDVVAGAWADDGNLASGAIYRTSAVTLDNEIFNVGGSVGSFSYTGLASRHVQCVEPANIFVDPLSLGATQPPGSTTGQPLTVSNTGVQDLTWSIVEEPDAPFEVSVPGGPAQAPAGTVVAAGPYTARPESVHTLLRRSGGRAPANVLLLNADDDNNISSPIQALLQGYGDLGAVDLFNATTTSPTLAQLQAYDVVLTWSNYLYADPTAIGNVLADYVDAGGKVVDLLFGLDPSAGYAGRFRTDGYSAMSTTTYTFLTDCLGAFDPTHPIMAGVTNVCDYYRATGTTLTAGSSAVASWADGELFVAAKDNGTVASIAGYVGYYYNWTGQMPDVVHNAILWLADGVQPICTNPSDVPWLAEVPNAGTTAAGASTTVDVTYNSTGLADGVYTANLCVESNDPDAGPGNETELVIVPVTLTVETLAVPSISLVKTVGTDPAVCAATSAITVAPGTTVYYCFAVTNTGDVTLNLHDLSDDVLGTIFSGLNYALTPGSSVNTVAAGLSIPHVANSTTTNTGTWTAYNVGGPSVQATAEATVTVADPPDVDVSPMSLISTQMSNQIATLPLTLGNVGGSDLVWNILEEPAMTAPPVAVPPVETLNPAVDLEAELTGLDDTTPAATVRDPAAAALARRLLQLSGLLLVPDSTADRVMAFDPVTGNLVDADFIPADPTNLSTPKSAILSAAGDSILVADQIDDVVQEYDLDGNYLGVFAPAGGANTAILDNIVGIDLRSNGNLLVTVQSGANADSVAEFDTSGVYLGNFVANAAGGLDGPFDVFPLGSDWLVPSITTDNVLRFDSTGAPLGVFAPAVSFGEQVNIAGNGNVLVANFSAPNSGVMEFTPAGALVGVYSVVTGNRGVYELPNGNILTSNGSGVHEIDRLGNLVSTKYTGTGAQYIEFVAPMTSCDSPADVPWLSANPTAGTIAPSGNQVVTVGFDSTGIALGTYQATICLFSNDPDEPVVPVPVTMDVVIPVELQSFSVE